MVEIGQSRATRPEVCNASANWSAKFFKWRWVFRVADGVDPEATTDPLENRPVYFEGPFEDAFATDQPPKPHLLITGQVRQPIEITDVAPDRALLK